MNWNQFKSTPIFSDRCESTVTCHWDACDPRWFSIANDMIGLTVFTIMLWTLVSSEDSRSSETFLEKKKRSAPRGYYAGLGYPYLPFAEPLTILAGLAFLAYIIQAFHAMYHHHNHGLGGVLNNVLPSKSRDPFSKATNQSDIKITN